MGLLNTKQASKLTNSYFLYFHDNCHIGFGGFHHSIVGNIEVFGAFYIQTQYTLDYLKFCLMKYSGNAIGGSVVVGSLSQ
jgi:formate/nitrite transporter FocA (FNT family)